MKIILTYSLLLFSFLLFVPQASAEFVQKAPTAIEKKNSEQRKRGKRAVKPKKEKRSQADREANAEFGLTLSIVALALLIAYTFTETASFGILGIATALFSLILSSTGLQSEQHGFAVAGVILSTIVLTISLSALLIGVLLI